MRTKLAALALAGVIALGAVGAAAAAPRDAKGPSGGPPNPSGQCPTGNTPGCSPHR